MSPSRRAPILLAFVLGGSALGVGFAASPLGADDPLPECDGDHFPCCSNNSGCSAIHWDQCYYEPDNFCAFDGEPYEWPPSSGDTIGFCFEGPGDCDEWEDPPNR